MHFTSLFLRAAAVAFFSATSTSANPVSALRSHFGTVVAFGDSLSDNGNVYRLTNRTWPADKAYYKGRFSNGKTWVENLAKDIGVLLHPGGGPADLLDLAYGGATVNNSRIQGLTGYNSTIPVPSVLGQVRTYLKSSSKGSISRSLFVISGGSNDAFFGLGGPIAPEELARLTAADLLTASRRLYKAGARYFLIPGVAALQSIPYVNDYGEAYEPSLDSYGDAFYDYLKAHVDDAGGKGATVVLFDQRTALTSFINKKKQRPDWNVEDACLKGVYPGEAPVRSLCSDPDKHVFFDIYHPSRVTHKYIARAALETIFTTITGKALPLTFTR
ncbi:unnamed protein product [Tilletia controversa]|nr:unnamed protein product [Tilletia controversa]CAD6969213.1 unnamed protein product [Tilletia controversa]CAD6976063.1 unnamed protein product [Tilletia controversa]